MEYMTKHGMPPHPAVLVAAVARQLGLKVKGSVTNKNIVQLNVCKLIVCR